MTDDIITRTPKQIGAAIRRRRRQRGLNQKQLGDLMNARQATVSTLENGEPGTQLGTLVDALTALGLELVVRPRTEVTQALEDLI